MKAKHNNKKVIMWYKVKELNSKGLNKSQISRELSLDRSTVRKYLNMNEEDFYQWIEKPRCLPNKLQDYYDFIKKLLEGCSSLSASQIEDRLKENYSEPPLVHSKTVYNFVQKIRRIENIKKTADAQPRRYQKLPELEYGHQAQADFGQYYMLTKDNSRKKVHFMVMVLCRSRYKFVYFQDKPFTSSTTIIAHEKGLQYFGGQPREIVYDQDRVLIVDENLGDILLTREFSSYCKQMDFKPVFCRKSDPESKGKVENVVGFVKKNFLRGRIYSTLNDLNSRALGWLERTGNGKEHAGIKKIPSQEWIIEQPYLKLLRPGITMKEELKKYKVRKDNTISYKSNFYTLPLGTYSNADTWILLEEADDMVYLYTIDNELLTTHLASTEKGSTVSNKDHRRDKSESISVLKESILKMLPGTEKSTVFIERLQKDKPRYLRDNLLIIERKGKEMPSEFLSLALTFCLENNIFNGNQLIEIANHYKTQTEQESKVKYNIPEIKLNNNLQIMTTTIQTSKISLYENIM
ncbi:MAG: IS21 family transposase [Bacteroidota bacterium]